MLLAILVALGWLLTGLTYMTAHLVFADARTPAAPLVVSGAARRRVRIVFVRHGQSWANAFKTNEPGARWAMLTESVVNALWRPAQSVCFDSPLNDQGAGEAATFAAVAAPRLAEKYTPADSVIVASNQRRAMATAALCFQERLAHDGPVTADRAARGYRSATGVAPGTVIVVGHGQWFRFLLRRLLRGPPPAAAATAATREALSWATGARGLSNTEAVEFDLAVDGDGVVSIDPDTIASIYRGAVHPPAV